jgi:ABC-type Fe3+/spermidine/putrescine transport system ATPase subunit
VTPLVSWENVSRHYGEKPALDGVNLSIAAGEILSVLGPSGSGKSTLLRLTAGLETPTTGRILSTGRDITALPPHVRGFGLMFQDYCLFPHLSVAGNVEFGLRMLRWDRRRRDYRTRQMLRLVRMEEFATRSVLSLSGGEQQRVALARSLAPSPRLLMLDEPLGALDAALRGELVVELGRILLEVGATAVYVTHDHREAMTIGSRVALLNAGRVEQVGAPAEIVGRPANGFVASFLGLGALVPAEPRQSDGVWVMRTGLGAIPVGRAEVSPAKLSRDRAEVAADAAGTTRVTDAPRWTLLVRPSAIRFAAGSGLHRVPARIMGRGIEPSGAVLRIALRTREGIEYPLDCFLPGEVDTAWQNMQKEKLAAVWIDPRACMALRSR